MNYLSVEQLCKTWQDEPVLHNLNFGIAKGEKVALVANNGSGKTTLLNIIAGIDEPDSGKAILRKDINIAYLPQEPNLNPQNTVIEQLLSFKNEATSVLRDYEIALIELEKENNQANRSKVDVLIEKMNALNAWDYESRVKQIAGKLQITYFSTQIEQLSGGQKKRVALAQALLSNPDFIILDEPTNHLDFDMIEWLEQFLAQKDLSLLLVTHDRYFLDRVCNQIIELHQAKLFHYKGNYSYFIENKELRQQIEETEHSKTKNLYKKELEWARRMPKARGTKSKSRLESFDQVKNKLQSYKTKQELNISTRMERLGSKILELHKISKSYGNLNLIKDFNYIFKKGEKVGILGPNGTGKSTLLNIITQELQPDTGKVVLGDTLVLGYYTQHNQLQNETAKIIDCVREIADFFTNAEGHKVTAMSLLNHFGFSPAKQQNYVYTLSGGEKRRLQLLRMLMQNPNFIILDEPTNDLDLETLVKLEDFLVAFGGCLIIVSHDRYFMDRIVDHLFVFEGEGVIRDFPGNYSEYREWQDLQEAEAIVTASNPAIAAQTYESLNEKPKKKLSFKEQFELEQIEKQMPLMQQKIAKTEEKLTQLSTEFEEIAALSKELQGLKAELEMLELRWLELEELKN